MYPTRIYLIMPKGMPRVILKAYKIESDFLCISYNDFHDLMQAELPSSLSYPTVSHSQQQLETLNYTNRF